MNLVYKHGQRYGLIPRDEPANPMNWVRQKTTSNDTAVIMNPQQAFEILLNIPEPRRTLVLTDAATALRVSEILGLMWMDLDLFGSASHNFRHSLASSLVKLKCDPKTVQGVLRHEDVRTTGRRCNCMRSPTRNRDSKHRAKSWHCYSETKLTCSRKRSRSILG
jgi:integrase